MATVAKQIVVSEDIEGYSDDPHEQSFSFAFNEYFGFKVSREFNQFLMDVELDLELETETSAEVFHAVSWLDPETRGYTIY